MISFLLIIFMRFTWKLSNSLFYLILLSGFISSCTVVKNAPAGKPFVFDNQINITGNLNKDEKKKLTNELGNYWDDSLFARKVQQLGVRFVLRNPPVFDTLNLIRTETLMKGYLNSQGYYNATFTNIDSSYSFDTVENEIRTKISLNIDPGKSLVIDSLYYDLQDSSLNKISTNNARKSFIKQGKTPFSKQVIATELDREVALFRQRGYFLLTRDNLFAEVDTTDLSLLAVTLDPFEQAQRIAAAAQRRSQNPTCIVAIKKRESRDTLPISEELPVFKKYYIGNIYYYPETGRYDQPDSLITDTGSMKRIHVNFHTEFFKSPTPYVRFRPLKEHTYQRKGIVYNEENFYKTLNNFNQIGAWERVDYRTFIREDTVDFHYFLTPAKKQTLGFYIEASRNTGDLLTSGTLIGLALNTNYINRNVWHSAIQSNTTFSNGVEFSFLQNNSLLQTFQSTINHSYTFPRFILVPHFLVPNPYKLDGIKTKLGLSASYVDRKDFYRLRSFVANWGYEWKKKNILFAVKIPNIELYSLDTLKLLDSAFNVNPFLRTSFNTGTVVGMQGSMIISYAGKSTRVNNLARFAVEESGAVLGRISSFHDKIYQYIKFEAEYRKLITYRKTALAFRAFGGVGYNYGKDERFGKTLPFFKQFVGGGPNSMRAWGLRLIGLGSSISSDTAASFRDRYGDMQLEANTEYRFNIAEFSAVKVGSALFVDAGNVWNLHANDASQNSEFSFNRLGKDIAIGVGTGLRFDFGYFMIRVDMGIKLKDPARYENNGWLSIKDFTWKNYEYTDKGAPSRNNYAVQLGIGLPF
ncbi:BamA/TamA family outer membrane protein [Panacibacter ginsenosidivorans]|uniref:BamA/TamA family outer membrane protein n=1 Tax=Panacibacter ginsenosidivorans TaxID=1813871 RepID=A0A5B8VE73_9BACT|nr:BamA/TamA family outer membrane protein [Panacibacter ginsenosidivorans]QEC68956.1 BamA/TamA family outer membrane protein [Panacibacter ginsenosidivorans]